MDQEPLSNLEWAQMVDVSCVPAGENPKGELKSGHAILRGKMLPVTVQFGVWETGRQYLSPATIIIDTSKNTAQYNIVHTGEEFFCHGKVCKTCTFSPDYNLHKGNIRRQRIEHGSTLYFFRLVEGHLRNQDSRLDGIMKKGYSLMLVRWMILPADTSEWDFCLMAVMEL